MILVLLREGVFSKLPLLRPIGVTASLRTCVNPFLIPTSLLLLGVLGKPFSTTTGLLLLGVLGGRPRVFTVPRAFSQRETAAERRAFGVFGVALDRTTVIIDDEDDTKGKVDLEVRLSEFPVFSSGSFLALFTGEFDVCRESRLLAAECDPVPSRSAKAASVCTWFASSLACISSPVNPCSWAICVARNVL